MKIKYSVWISDSCHVTHEREIDSWDYTGILEKFDDVVDLYAVRIENMRLRRELNDLKPKPVLETPTVTILTCRHCGDPFQGDNGCGCEDVSPHNPMSVFEYDGAYRCRDCGAQWEALPGKPKKPAECNKPKPKGPC